MGRCIPPLFLTPAASAGIFGLWGILCSRVAAATKWDLRSSRSKKGESLSLADSPNLLSLSDEYWETVACNTDRARRRLLRSAGFRAHLFDEPGAFECDAPLDGGPGDEDPPLFPLVATPRVPFVVTFPRHRIQIG